MTQLRKALTGAAIAWLILAGCAVPTLAPPTPTVPQASPAGQTVDVQATLTPAWQVVATPEAGVSFEVPADWQTLEQDQGWTPPGAEGRLGFHWREVPVGSEVEAAFLDSGRVMQDSQAVELGWATGRRYTLERMGEDNKVTLEQHVVVRQGGRAFDLYVAAPSASVLKGLLPTLEHALNTLVSSAPAAASATPTLLVEEYPIVAATEDAPDHFEYMQRIGEDILARRLAWRNRTPASMVIGTNRVLAPFGYHLEPNPISSSYEFQLFRGGDLVLDKIGGFRPAMTNAGGDDFLLWLQSNSHGEKIVQREGIQDWEPAQRLSTPPILWGDQRITVYNEGEQAIAQADGQTIFRTPAVFVVTDPVKGLWPWDGHWVLEVDGQVFVDGENATASRGYDEMFEWKMLAGQPFFFFLRDGKIGVSYAGQELSVSYDEVVHYRCCEPAAFNPSFRENIVSFHALRDGVWQYVEMGVYAGAATAVDAEARQVVADFLWNVREGDVENALSHWTFDGPDQPAGLAQTVRGLIAEWAVGDGGWVIVGVSGEGLVATGDYRVLDLGDPRVQHVTVSVRNGPAVGAFSLLQTGGRWKIAGWLLP